MRPCFAPHAGGAAPRAARRNSPTSSTGAQLRSRTECDESTGRARTGAPITNERREKQAARRLRGLRLHSVRRLCSYRHYGQGDHGSLMEPATRSRLRFGDGILAAEQAAPRPSTPQASDGSALSRGSANALGPRQIVARGAQAPSWLPSRRYGRVTARAGGSAKSRVSLCFR
jgi:hypothetical protein